MEESIYLGMTADGSCKYYVNTTNDVNWSNCATCGSVFGYQFTNEPKRRNEMNLYKVYVIDKYRGVLMSEHTCIGKDAAEAALGFQLSADERAVKEKDDLEIIWQNVGTFEKREVQRVLTEK